MPKALSDNVPVAMRAVFDPLAAVLDAFCAAHLNAADAAFVSACRGSFTSALRWPQFDALWAQIRADAAQVRQLLVDALADLLRREHAEALNVTGVPILSALAAAWFSADLDDRVTDRFARQPGRVRPPDSPYRLRLTDPRQATTVDKVQRQPVARLRAAQSPIS